MNATSTPLYDGRQAVQKLNIIIVRVYPEFTNVGAGMGGLAAAHCLGQAGHKVTVFESAPAIGEVGAGIQACPNMAKLLIKWGLKDELERRLGKDAPAKWTFINYSSGEMVGAHDIKKVVQDHGNPWYVVHRADLFDMLHQVAEPFMDLRINCKVQEVDPLGPSVTLESGEKFTADLVIGADGIHSAVRRSVLENELPLAINTGDMAYRVLVPTDSFKDDPELQELIDNPRVNCWMGPGRHIIGYSIRGRNIYNLVMIGPDDGSMESWTARGSVEEVREFFKGWEPRIQKLISHFDPTKVLKSKLVICSPLKRWVHPAGRAVLLGDACHPMLASAPPFWLFAPYKAQGAAMALEDAAVLGNLFSRITDRSEIPFLTKAYEELRHARATGTQSGALDNRHLLHMDDGPEQEARDAKMRLALELDQAGIDHDGSLNDATIWSNKEKVAQAFGYDADKSTDEWWASHVLSELSSAHVGL
ncbi:hypothetical protein PQX77_005402 [Marasmius sp. AFHP31]|nr:hypothetical protein PQX77_005402 [Marasmius sp. AFHP31]